MAWVWWLLAPVASTAVGAVVIWWRAQGGVGKRLRGSDPVAEHQALLRALAHGPLAHGPLAHGPTDEVPATMRVLTSERPAN
jgi:hypothetical protein